MNSTEVKYGVVLGLIILSPFICAATPILAGIAVGLLGYAILCVVCEAISRL